MEHFSWLYVLPVAFLLDWVLGDPRWMPHPISLMGKIITKLEPRFRSLPWSETLSGVFFAVILIAGTWLSVFLGLKILGAIHPAIKIVLEIILIYFALSVRSLEQMAMAVFEPLSRADIKSAKQNLARIVGRDVSTLDAPGVSRASVETIAENLVDGVISPLIFAVLGGAPLALAYKMVNTLDSMIGYKNETYQFFGKAGARIDDLVNYIPARVSIFVIALAAEFTFRTGLNAFWTALKQGRRHSSPNAGYPEASFAGALQRKLGGPNYYFGTLVSKPYIGEQFQDTVPADIKTACNLMLCASVSMLAIVWVVIVILNV